jgi:hypothetical protein
MGVSSGSGYGVFGSRSGTNVMGVQGNGNAYDFHP